MSRRKEWRARPKSAKTPHADPIKGVNTTNQKVDLIITKVDPSTLPPMRSRKRKLPP